MTKIKLNRIASVRTGLVTARKQAKGFDSDKSHSYRMLSLRCIKEPGIIDTGYAEPYTSKDNLKPDVLTKNGDILVRLSAPYTAALIDKETENFVVPSHFAIIRVDEEKVDSAYVLWILRQPSTLKQIYQNASGTTAFGTISSNFFGELPINNLPIEKQRIIGELLKLSEKEQILLSNLMKAKSDLNKIALQQAYKNFNRGRK